MKLPKLHRLTKTAGLLLGAGLLLVACGSAAPESAAVPVAESGQEQPTAQPQAAATQPPATSLPTDTPAPVTDTPAPAEAPTEAAEPAPPPTEEAPPVKPTPRQELMATSPGEVALASGQVQLVEFFAYW